MIRSGQLSFTNQEAASISGERIGFSFGQNWRRFLTNVDDSTIKHAEDSFIKFTRQPRLDASTFLDIGCGSGLSSLVAYRLGARRIVSTDIDPNSINCVTALRERFANGTDNWDILRASVLDGEFIRSVGRFSYVYSWGVLHHTGYMWQAIENVIDCVEPNGKLHIAIYNEHRTSAIWLKVKRLCNRFPRTVFPILKIVYALLVCMRLLMRFQSPITYFRHYRRHRGMSFWRDVDDWLGGLPYEYCKPDQVINFLSDRGFALLRLGINMSTGTNEFLFIHLGK
jgi:2-polyprenyl-6-hydroxyphenyl methylase/3-demethylubiquinone-9 3-methyltransferase